MVVDDMSGFSLWYAVRKKGKPPARVSPLFGFAENSPLPALWKHRRISLTAVSDQDVYKRQGKKRYNIEQNTVGTSLDIEKGREGYGEEKTAQTRTGTRRADPLPLLRRLLQPIVAGMPQLWAPDRGKPVLHNRLAPHQSGGVRRRLRRR